jgi:hypothetical protein
VCIPTLTAFVQRNTIARKTRSSLSAASVPLKADIQAQVLLEAVSGPNHRGLWAILAAGLLELSCNYLGKDIFLLK